MTTPKTKVNNSSLFDQKARQIKAQTSKILTKWGLVPRFKRWRLTQDADTGMIVLFGVLNNSYIAKHTSIPFNNYFDQQVLHDLADDLGVQVVSCNSDGLRYAFILDRGSLGKIPTHIDFPFMEGDEPFVRVVYAHKPLAEEEMQPQATPPLTAATAEIDDQALVDQGVGAFLKVFDDIKLRDELEQSSAQNPPNILVIDEGEFNKRVAAHEASRQRHNRLGKLFDNTAEKKR